MTGPISSVLLPLLLVALAGGLGACARFAVDTAIRSRWRTVVPAGTMIINITGSLLLGLVVGLASGPLPELGQQVVGTGFLGGYTTFSTASVETVVLLRERRGRAAVVNALGTVLAATAAAALGLLVGLSVR